MITFIDSSDNLFTLSITFSIIVLILFISFPVLSDNDLISCATTENPLPASPALAASIEAFKASKLVCSAIALIEPDISVICSITFVSSIAFSNFSLLTFAISMALL